MTDLDNTPKAAGPTQATPGTALRLGRPQDAYAALGMAVDHLMTKPAYANVRFSSWAKILAGQINRQHYVFIFSPANRVVGMLGWAYADRAAAELWMTGRPAPFGDGRNGDSVIFNIYSADDPDAAGPLLLRAGRQAMLGKSMMYSRRFYPDGRIRPWKMPVSRFVRKHLADTDPAGG